MQNQLPSAAVLHLRRPLLYTATAFATATVLLLLLARLLLRRLLLLLLLLLMVWDTKSFGRGSTKGFDLHNSRRLDNLTGVCSCFCSRSCQQNVCQLHDA